MGLSLVAIPCSGFLLTRRFGAQMGRTEADIQFYEDALAVAKKMVLPDHSTGEAYLKVGNAFITNVSQTIYDLQVYWFNLLDRVPGTDAIEGI